MRIERELAKDRADLPECDRRLIEFEVNQVMVAVHLVAQPGNRPGA